MNIDEDGRDPPQDDNISASNFATNQVFNQAVKSSTS